MKLRAKMLSTFASIIVILILIISVGIIEINTDVKQTNKLKNETFPHALSFFELELCIIQIQQYLTDISATRAAEGYDGGFKKAEKYYHSANGIIDHLINNHESKPEVISRLEEAKEELNGYYSIGKKMANVYIEDGPKSGNLIKDAFDRKSEKLIDLIKKMKEEYKNELDVTVAGINSRTASLRLFSIIGTIAALAISIIIAIFVTNQILGGIKAIIYNLKDLSEGNGDLTVQLHVKTKDELGEMADYFNKFVKRISDVLSNIKDSVSTLSTISDEINSTAGSMSQTSNEQAANVEEITSSLEEMGATISQNAENSKVTDEIAQNTASKAEEGGSAVDETVEAMKRIAKEIGLIEDIAYQTNLLALNAAIEAARAGEHGKGFAVVAGEVRKLAEKSQMAAQEISGLAAGSVDIAERAGKLLEEIVPSIKKTADLVQDITSASEQQDLGVKQISQGMEQLNEVTQQNAGSSEELAATSQVLQEQASYLKQIISYFKVERDGGFSRKKSANIGAIDDKSEQNAQAIDYDGEHV